MKKLLTIILILALAVPAAAFADLPDISNLSYDELIQLKDSINLAICNSQEWQEVTSRKGSGLSVKIFRLEHGPLNARLTAFHLLRLETRSEIQVPT